MHHTARKARRKQFCKTGIERKQEARQKQDKIKGKKVLIVDDVISTGASLASLESLVERAGGIIVGKMAVLAEGDATERKDIIYLEKLPLFDKNGNAI